MKAKKPKRARKAKNITLSDDARTFGETLAKSRGMKFAQLIEFLLREEVRRKKLK